MLPTRRTAVLAAGMLAVVAGLSCAAGRLPHGRPFGGVAYVGPLFRDAGGRLGPHFCTAAVVHSHRGNLLITSAHCMGGVKPAGVAFAPGYAGGHFRYGVYRVAGVLTDRAWAQHHSIDDDVAILRLRSDVERRTGALTLATGLSPRATKVIGYSDESQRPIECTAATTWFRKRQQEKFVCGGYEDGTSGAPWIIRGTKEVYGVIGGYHQGGDVSYISYSPYFGSNIRALYDRAVARDG